MANKKVVLVTGSDLAEQAMAILHDFEVVFAGRQPTEDELIALCEQHNPVAILVRYGKISAKIMDAAPALQVISKHGSGIDVIDQAAAAERNIVVRSAFSPAPNRWCRWIRDCARGTGIKPRINPSNWKDSRWD